VKVVRLSALRTGRIYPPGNIPGTHSAAGRIMSVKNSSDTIGNRTCDLPTCSAVPQPTVPPRASIHEVRTGKFEWTTVGFELGSQRTVVRVTTECGVHLPQVPTYFGVEIQDSRQKSQDVFHSSKRAGTPLNMHQIWRSLRCEVPFILRHITVSADEK